MANPDLWEFFFSLQTPIKKNQMNTRPKDYNSICLKLT